MLRRRRGDAVGEAAEVGCHAAGECLAAMLACVVLELVGVGAEVVDADDVVAQSVVNDVKMLSKYP